MKYFILILSLLISACTTQISSLKQGGNTEIYEMSEKEIFQIVYDVMSNTESKLIVREIQGVERGYEVINTFSLDWRKTTVRIIPLEGIDINGENVKGYYYTVLERANTPLLNTNIIENLKNRLNQTNTKIILTKFWKIDYEYNRENIRLNKSPSTRENKVDITNRLLKLKQLLEQEIITKEEYQERRISILSEL
jgi:hypothetical protein